MTLQESTFNTAHVMDNEIIKANDFEFAFENLVTNVSKACQMFLESTQDFVINGKVLPDVGMNVKVSPIFGVCKETGIPFGRIDTATMEYGFEQSATGRIDIIEVKGEWETYDQQQRAFNDPDTDTQTYQYVKTKKLMKPVYQIKQGIEGGSVAPEVDEGWVKLAEVVIQANANTITADDIKNITSDVAGESNVGWTTEDDITYNIGYISDVNARFRVQHNADGTHKSNVINAVSLDIGTGTNQINGNILPVGGSVSIPNETIAATDSILSVFVKAASMLTSLYNAYLKYGNYGVKGILSISSIVNDGTDVLKKPISISAAGDGTAVIKIDNAAVLSIDATGKLSTNGYTASSNNHLVTKAVTDAINTALTNLTNRVNDLVPQLDNTLYVNNVLSGGTDGRFNIESTNIYAASTQNLTLSGTQTVDGITPGEGSLILVKNQTDAKENGIYQYSSDSLWQRSNTYITPDLIKGKVFNILNGTTNGGKMFYTPIVSFVDPDDFGTDEITFSEYFGSIKELGKKAAIRDVSGHVKTADPTNAMDSVNKQSMENAIFGTVYSSSKTGTGDHAMILKTSPITLTAGTTIKVLFTGDCYYGSADASAPNDYTKYPKISVDNGTTYYPIKSYQNGNLDYLKCHKVTAGIDVNGYWWWWMGGTTMNLIFDGSAFVVMDNPTVLEYSGSTQSYTVKANGFIKQTFNRDIDMSSSTTVDITFPIPFTDTNYTHNSIANLTTASFDFKITKYATYIRFQYSNANRVRISNLWVEGY